MIKSICVFGLDDDNVILVLNSAVSFFFFDLDVDFLVVLFVFDKFNFLSISFVNFLFFSLDVFFFFLLDKFDVILFLVDILCFFFDIIMSVEGVVCDLF